MAKRQKRRSISINVDLFELSREQAKHSNKSLSHWVADLIRDELKRLGVELPAQHFATTDDVARMELAKFRASIRRNTNRPASATP
jgi:hypothetical protein